MPRPNYDMKEFRKMVKAGKTAKEIKTKFKWKNEQSVKSALLSLIMEDQTVYNIKGAGREASSTVKFGNYGVRLSAERLKKLGFKKNDKLSIEKKKDTIVMKRV